MTRQKGLVKIISIIFISKYKPAYTEDHVLWNIVWRKIPMEDCQSSNSVARKTGCPSYKDKANFIIVFKILLYVVHITNFASVRKSDADSLFWMSTALQQCKRGRKEKQEIKLHWCHQETKWNLEELILLIAQLSNETFVYKSHPLLFHFRIKTVNTPQILEHWHCKAYEEQDWWLFSVAG